MSTNPVLILIRAHDHVWKDRQLGLAIRVQTCRLLMKLAIEICEGKK